jgi:nitrite reductase/ring-hydroxylating ferredoxin subunit
MKWFKIPGLLSTDQPFIKKASVNGKSICLVGYQGEVFALSSKCPHAGEDLSRGWCTDDGKLVCPIHRFSYNLTNGRGSTGQNDYVDTYAVKTKDDEIYVGFETFREKFLKIFK